jgi:hypothetical protein
MPCLAVLFALMAPRFTIIVLWLFTGWFKGVFETVLWPVLGFFFMPMTMLWFSAVQNWWNGDWGFWQIAGMVIAVMIDMGSGSGARKKRKKKKAQAEPEQQYQWE